MRTSRCVIVASMASTLACCLPASAEIWGLKCSSGNSLWLDGQTLQPPRCHLFRFDEYGVAFTDIGRVKLNGTQIDADGLAISDGSGLLAFQLQTGSSTLIAVNPATAEAIVVGPPMSGRRIRGATFDLSGRLWAFDELAGQLLEVHPGSGVMLGAAITLTVNGNPLDNTYARFGSDIAIRCDGAMLLSIHHDAPFTTQDLFTVNTVTGAMKLVGHIPGAGDAGVTFSKDSGNPDQMFTFEVQGCDDLYSFDIGACFTKSTLFLNILPLYLDCPGFEILPLDDEGLPAGINSGPGDLAALVVANAGCVVHNLNADCNNNGQPDCLDVGQGGTPDCNNNQTADCIDLALGSAADCNGNSMLDSCDIAASTSLDGNGNGTPDECEDPATLASDLCNAIRALPLAAFNGPNDNANQGRRTSMANRACHAADRIADGHFPAAIALLNSVYQQVDDQSPPPDWMHAGADKSSIAQKIVDLIARLQ